VDVRSRIRADDILISGGAAWADHLAVHAFLNGWCQALELYLPAPLQAAAGKPAQFWGGFGTSGGAANHYHELFAKLRGVDGRDEILEAARRGALLTNEAPSPGYAAMMRRNAKVAARCSDVLAYTFGAGEEPADGGTLTTWRMCKVARKVHVPLGVLAESVRESQAATEQPSRLAIATPGAPSPQGRARYRAG